MKLTPKQLGVLRGARLLSGLSPARLQILLDAVTPQPLAQGSVLFTQGELGDSMAILVEGRLGVFLTRPDGQPEPMGSLQPGAVVGEMACLDPARRSATVVATAPSVVLTLTRQTLDDLRATLPAVEAGLVGGIIAALAARLRETNARIDEARGAPRPGDPSAASPPRGAPPPEGIRIDLERIPILKGMTHRDLDLLTSVAPPMAWPDGTVLCREGTIGSSCYLLLDGQVDVIRGGGDAEELLATLEPRTLVGQLSLIDRAPRSATVRARGAIIAQEMQRDVFERLLAAASPLGLRFQAQLAVSGIRQLRLANAALMAARAEQDEPAHSKRLVYVQAALSEWNLPLEELHDVSELTEVGNEEDTADLTELFHFQDLTEVDPHAPAATVEVSALTPAKERS